MTLPPLQPMDGSDVYWQPEDEHDPILEDLDAVIIPRSQPNRDLEDFDDGE